MSSDQSNSNSSSLHHACQRRQKRERENEHDNDTEPQDDGVKSRTKRLKFSTSENIFDSHMTDDTFLHLLRFFVSSDSGVVDGQSIRSVMLVSKRWYAAASSQTLWKITAVPGMNENVVHRIAQRPSPCILEMNPRSSNFPNLIGFANLSKRKTSDGRPSYTVRERATGKLFTIDILNAEDNRAVRSAVSAHTLLGDSFLSSQQDEQSLFYLPVGMENSNGRVVRWFNHMTSLNDYFHGQAGVSRGSTPQLENTKMMLRQLLEAVFKIHSTDSVHGCIDTQSIYVDLSTESQLGTLNLECSALFPVVSSFTPSTKCLGYTSPEILIPLSKGLRTQPTRAADMWSVGCVVAEIIRQGVPLFGSAPLGWEHDGRTNSLARYARRVCRLVGRPPSFSSAMRSLQHNEFPLDSTEFLKKELGVLGKSGLDLMMKLLSPDPTRRPTAEEALAHPFLSEKGLTPLVKPIVSEPVPCELKRISSSIAKESQLSPNRRHVRMDAWATLVDYIIEIVEVFDLTSTAAFRAIHYFDRFFSSYHTSESFTSRRCQLVAATCLYIASKCDEIEFSKSDLAFCADNTFDENDVTIAEHVIVHELKWKLSFPTIIDFVEQMCDALNLEDRVKPRMMARYIAELALQCQVHLAYQPSLVASCVVVLALFSTGTADPWPDSLVKATDYSWNDLEGCMLALSSGIHQVRATMPNLKIILRRYRKNENGRVGHIHIPRVTVFASLRNPRAHR